MSKYVPGFLLLVSLQALSATVPDSFPVGNCSDPIYHASLEIEKPGLVSVQYDFVDKFGRKIPGRMRIEDGRIWLFVEMNEPVYLGDAQPLNWRPDILFIGDTVKLNFCEIH